jgi:hypothetical protein
MAMRQELLRFTRVEYLLEDYGRESADPGYAVLSIPGQKITAARTLPMDNGNGDRSSVLDLRVVSSADAPTVWQEWDHGENRYVERSVQLGRWYRLPLVDVAITAVPEQFA